MVYFKKFDPRQKVYLPDGRNLQFSDVGNGYGVFATEDTYTIGQLRVCIQEHRGGVDEVSLAEYEEVKKKEPMNCSEKNFREMLDVKKLSILFRKLKEGVVVEDDERFHSDVGYRAEDIAKPIGKTGYRPQAVAR